MQKSIVLAAGICLSLAGCTKAVTISEPHQPITQPVFKIRVQFAQFFRPGSFRAQLDGSDVTSQFVPTAAAGGVAQMNLPDDPQGFTGGTAILSPQPSNPLPVSQLPSDVHFTPGVGPPNVNSNPPSGPSGKTPPNITFYVHHLEVTGECSGMICSVKDTSNFVPIHLFGIPTTMNLRVGERTIATVSTFPPAAVTVKLRPSSASISLNQLPPGQETTATTNASGSASFNVTGVQSGNLLIYLEAPGLQRGGIQGVVNR